MPKIENSMGGGLQRRIVAILASDIAGYSRLVAEDEEETLRRLANYRAVFDDFIVQFGGRIFNTAGDAVLVEFKSAVDAVRCAVDVQESLRARNAAYPASRRMSYRMGITIGDVVERDGDLLGEGVNIAARLESVAPVGGICVSGPVYEAVQNKLSVRFNDIGQQQLKNIPNPVRAFALDLQSGRLDGRKSLALAMAAGPTMLVSAAALVAAGLALFAARSLWEGGENVATETQRPAQQGVETLEAKDLSARTDQPTDSAGKDGPSPQSQNGDGDTIPAAESALADDAGQSTSTDTPTDGRESGSTADGARSDRPKSDTADDAHDRVVVPEQQSRRPSTDRVAQEAVLRGDWQRCANERKLEDYLAAIAACERLLENHWVVEADVATILFNKGRALRQLGRFDEAIATYTAAIDRRETAEAYNLRGAIHYDKGDWSRAISDFGQAITLEAHNGEYRNNRAWTLYKSGRVAEALDDANAAVAALRSVAYPWDTRGHIHEALGNRSEALEDYRKAVSIDPTLKSSREGLRRLGSQP